MTQKQFDNLLLGGLGLMGAQHAFQARFTVEELDQPRLDSSTSIFPIPVLVPISMMREMIGGLFRPNHLIIATRPADDLSDTSKVEITRMWAWTWDEQGQFWAQRAADTVIAELLQNQALFDLAKA